MILSSLTTDFKKILSEKPVLLLIALKKILGNPWTLDWLI